MKTPTHPQTLMIPPPPKLIHARAHPRPIHDIRPLLPHPNPASNAEPRPNVMKHRQTIVEARSVD